MSNKTSSPEPKSLILPSKQEEVLGIVDVKDNDVLYGRGQAIQLNEGNVRFRKLVALRTVDYKSRRNPAHRRGIAMEVIGLVRARGGRFLKRTSLSSTSETVWEEIDNTVALTKVKQALRDAAAAMVIPSASPHTTSQIPARDEAPSRLSVAGTSGDSAAAPATSFWMEQLQINTTMTRPVLFDPLSLPYRSPQGQLLLLHEDLQRRNQHGIATLLQAERSRRELLASISTSLDLARANPFFLPMRTNHEEYGFCHQGSYFGPARSLLQELRQTSSLPQQTALNNMSSGHGAKYPNSRATAIESKSSSSSDDSTSSKEVV